MSVVTASLAPDPPKRDNSEEKLGCALSQYLRFALPDNATFTHIPLGGQRHSRAAARLAAMGTKAGWPDYIIIHSGNAIFIELKRPGGGALSAVQKQVHEKLRLCGATVLVARSIEGIECALLELGVPLRASTGSRPMRVGGAAQQGLGV